MKTKLCLLPCMLFIVSTSTIAEVADPTQALLPETLIVYTDGATVINHPSMGFTEKSLPIINLYKGTPGCYIACYSHQKDNAAYSVGENTYVMGQVRIAGRYNARICEPINFEGKDISGDVIFKTMCKEKITSCGNGQCWAGGDTGGWFGVQ